MANSMPTEQRDLLDSRQDGRPRQPVAAVQTQSSANKSGLHGQRATGIPNLHAPFSRWATHPSRSCVSSAFQHQQAKFEWAKGEY